MRKWLVLSLMACGMSWLMAAASAETTAQTALAREVRALGWIIYGARTSAGDWDLFIMRPDGSQQTNITGTPQFNEGLPRFSPDDDRILYRRLPKGEHFDNNRHGMQGELIMAKNDGTQARVLGGVGEYPWASWSADGTQLICLSPQGITYIDLASRKILRRLDRRGFYQQLLGSPDGKWLTGVANSFATGWSVARMDALTGAVNPVSRVDCCTPDWFPDAQRIIFSRRPQQWTQLWMADGEGRQRDLVYAEEGRHVYGGCVSPDGRYVLFTGNKEEDGDPQNAGAPMALMRLSDAPIIGGSSKALREQFPHAKIGPVLELSRGWEPHWTVTPIRPDR